MTRFSSDILLPFPNSNDLNRASTKSKVELSVTLVNEFQPLTNVKKNSLFYVAGV